MSKMSKGGASQSFELPGFVGHYGEADAYTVGFEAYAEDSDPAELFKGLQNDRCQCPHWGVVLKGKLVYRYGDGGEDTITAGEAYYARPDHLPLFFADTEIVEFSPTDQLNETVAVVMKNLEG